MITIDKILVLIIAGIFVWGISFEVQAQEELAKKSREDLLYEDIAIVVTASRKEQPITESPSSVSIITAEDIRLAGADNIPDLLRTAAGVDVFMANAFEVEVSVRGFNDIWARRLLVMIDGRSVYQDFRGMVLWKSIPVTLAEIERIEIVRGPGSALYGANAFSGVINIITKTPQDLKGSYVSGRYGEYGTLSGSLIHAGEVNKVGYKISADRDETNQWWNRDKDAYQIGKGNIQLDYYLNNTSKLSLIGNYWDVKDGELGAAFGTLDFYAKESCAQIRYESKDFKLQTFYRQGESEDTVQTAGEKDKDMFSTYDLELQHSISLSEKAGIIWGGNYRYNTLDKGGLIPEDKKQTLWAGFLHNEYQLREDLALFFGGRYDWHSLTNGYYAPRGSIVYSSEKEHTFRASVATAFRNPSFIDFYAKKETVQTLGEAEDTSISMFLPNLPITFQYYGNEDIRPEKIESYELGYQTSLNKHLKTRVDLFVNRSKDFISRTPWEKTDVYTADELAIYLKGRTIAQLLASEDPNLIGLATILKVQDGKIPQVFDSSVENRGEMLGIGGELGMDLFLTDRLSATMNYSYQEYTFRKDDPARGVKKGDREKSIPLHKINAGLRFKSSPGITTNLSVHYVDEAEWTEGKVGAYTIVNYRVGHRFFQDTGEVYLSAFNLLNNKHYEYPPGSTLIFPDKYPLSDKIGSKITVGMSYRF